MGTGPVGKGPSLQQWAQLATQAVAGTVTAALPEAVVGPTAKAALAKAKDGFDAPPPLKPGAHGVRKGASPVHSASGKISSAEWADPARLMSRLTQNPHGKLHAQSSAACSAANMLGAALLSGGPDKAAALLDRVAKDGSLHLGPEEQKQLGGIASKIRDRTATFEDLNRAQELVYRAGNTTASALDLSNQAQSSNKLSPKEKSEVDKLARNGRDEARLETLLSKAFGREVRLDDGWEKVTSKTRTQDISGLTDIELVDLATAAAPGARQQPFTAPHDSIEGIANDLKPGEAVTIRIASDDKGGDPNHYVTVGRQQDGTFYLYNPDPSKGDATLVTGGKGPKADEGFLARTDQYNDRVVEETDMHGVTTWPPQLRYSP